MPFPTEAEPNIARSPEDAVASGDRSASPALGELGSELIERIADMVSRHSTDTTFLGVTAACTELLGYRPDELVGRTVFELAHSDELAVMLEHHRRMLDGGRSTLTLRLAHKDGTMVWVESTCRTYRNHAGDLEIAAVTRGIGARVQAERVLAAENKLLEQITRRAPLAEILGGLCLVCERQSEQVMCAVQLQAGDQLVLAAAPSLPSTLATVLTKVPIAPKANACAAAAYSRERVVTSDVRADDRWVEGYRAAALAHGIGSCWSTPIFGADGQLLGTFAGYGRGVRPPTPNELKLVDRLVHTASIAIERQRVADALRASEERYQSVVNSLQEVIFQVDGAGRLTFLSAAFAHVTGWAIDVKLGAEVATLVHPDDRARHQELLRTLLAGERTTGHDELRFLHGDGGFRWMDIRARSTTDATGAVTGVAGILADVTDRRKLEAQLLVSDRMASMGMLVAGVAHEINNPLAAVMLNVEYLNRELAGLRQAIAPELAAHLERLGESLRAIDEGADRVRDIVRNLKIFSRGEERRRLLDLHHVLESTLRLAANELRHRARVVKVYGELPTVEGNEGSLGQVFLNLIVNAAQAIREGQAEDNEIRIRTFTDTDGRAAVEVSDTGCGIPTDIVGRIFDPFFTTKPVGVGTGLGLSICHRLVTELGGVITVESRVGVGTSFRVTLPPASDSRLARPARTNPPKPHRRGRILVVDDEPSIGTSVGRFLGRDHEVAYAASGDGALARIRAGEQFDVILCDLMMPSMTGMDLHEALTREAPNQAKCMVFLTGGAFTERARTFLDSVPNPVLEKPFDMKLLVTTINNRLH